MSEQTQELAKIQREKALLAEKRIELIQSLPHLYGWKWYPWAREFFESTNQINLLCAANQVSKSSTQIRKCIDWATDMKKWPSLWKQRPDQFWYMYPSSNQTKIEYHTKWQQFLPQGRYKTDPMINGKPNPYHWKVETVNKEVHAIHFINTGVGIYFKSYTQNVTNLQTGTVFAMFADEEMPVELFDELMFRLSASSGYFHMVFTATIGQEFWRQCLQPHDHEEPLLPQAHKQIVSMYDCQVYDDGTPSHWTDEKIDQVKQRCTSHNEILKRVYGYFIKDIGGKKYEQFDLSRHVKPKEPIPKDWFIFAGVDIGSGGRVGHLSAITFVAVRPDFKFGRVFLGWRGDGILTTASDVVEKFLEMKRDHKLEITGQFYDWANKDFQTISNSMNENFQMADKSHERGEDIINALFKNNMLVIDENPELRKLAVELASLRKDTAKNKAKDDFADSFRYSVTRIPWDLNDLAILYDPVITPPKEMTPMERELAERRKAFEDPGTKSWGIEEEFAEANDLYGG